MLQGRYDGVFSNERGSGGRVLLGGRWKTRPGRRFEGPERSDVEDDEVLFFPSIIRSIEKLLQRSF